MRPSFVSLLMRPTAPPIWLGIAVAASLIVIKTLAVVYLKRLTGQPFGTLYMVDVMVVSTVWGFGLSAMTSVATAVAHTYFRNWPHTHFGPDELGFWLSIAVFLFVARSANTIAAAARTGERFSGRSSDLLAIAGPERLIPVNRACERYRLFPARLASICCEPFEARSAATRPTPSHHALFVTTRSKPVATSHAEPKETQWDTKPSTRSTTRLWPALRS